VVPRMQKAEGKRHKAKGRTPQKGKKQMRMRVPGSTRKHQNRESHVGELALAPKRRKGSKILGLPRAGSGSFQS
jgi:hypothetical protein